MRGVIGHHRNETVWSRMQWCIHVVEFFSPFWSPHLPLRATHRFSAKCLTRSRGRREEYLRQAAGPSPWTEQPRGGMSVLHEASM